LYTFYYPGFNVRSTDLQAFLGCGQLKRIDKMNQQRHKNFMHIQSHDNSGWKLDVSNYSLISNMAYPILSNNLGKIKKKLKDNNIEHRPLICGSIGRQPFWIERFGKSKLKNADYVHDNGIYVPNNPDLTPGEIQLIINCLW